MRKKIVGLIIIAVLISGTVFAGKPHLVEVQKTPNKKPPVFKPIQSYEDGTYRGFFADRGDIQVAVELKLENNHVTSINFRQLFHRTGGVPIDYRTEKENEIIIGLREQHEQLINYLVGKDIRKSLSDLYEPGSIVTDTVSKENGIDAYSGATLRSGKIISAVRDALNRGVYRY